MAWSSNGFRVDSGRVFKDEIAFVRLVNLKIVKPFKRNGMPFAVTFIRVDDFTSSHTRSSLTRTPIRTWSSKSAASRGTCSVNPGISAEDCSRILDSAILYFRHEVGTDRLNLSIDHSASHIAATNHLASVHAVPIHEAAYCKVDPL